MSKLTLVIGCRNSILTCGGLARCQRCHLRSTFEFIRRFSASTVPVAILLTDLIDTLISIFLCAASHALATPFPLIIGHRRDGGGGGDW